MSLQHLKHYILLMLIVMSKEILIVNEESVVLFSFGVFIILTYKTCGILISEELNLRSFKIEKEFNFYRDNNQKILNHLVSFYKKQTLLFEEVNSIFLFTKNRIQTVVLNYSQLFLISLTSVIEHKLKEFVLIQLKCTYSICQKFAKLRFFSFFGTKYRLYSKSKIKKKARVLFFKKCIKALFIIK